MNNGEFRKWFDAHRAAFPAVLTWLEKFPPIATEAQPSRAEIMAQWLDTLHDQKLDHCLTASAALGRGEYPPPEFPGETARAVRKLAREIAYRDFKLSPLPIENYQQRRYNCLRCLDDGRVICWHPFAMHAAKEGKFPHPKAMLTCAVRCDCSAGDKRASFMPVYNDRQWVLNVGDTEKDNAALLAWAAERVDAMTWNPEAT